MKTGGQRSRSAWWALVLWGLAFLWMAGIFYFSSLSDPLFFLGSAGRQAPVGKYFHVGEYAGLALILFFALRTTWGRPAGRSGWKCRSLTGEVNQAFPWALSFLAAAVYAFFPAPVPPNPTQPPENRFLTKDYFWHGGHGLIQIMGKEE